MNFLATVETWVAANQAVVMAVFVLAFVGFHLFLLAQAVRDELGAENDDVVNQDDEDFWAVVYATPWMM